MDNIKSNIQLAMGWVFNFQMSKKVESECPSVGSSLGTAMNKN